MSLHPIHMPRRIRRQEADAHGYAPHPDDLQPPAQHLRAPEGTDVLATFGALVDRAREINERTWTA